MFYDEFPDVSLNNKKVNLPQSKESWLYHIHVLA